MHISVLFQRRGTFLSLVRMQGLALPVAESSFQSPILPRNLCKRMPKGGLEPPRAKAPTVLSRRRMPIPPLRHKFPNKGIERVQRKSSSFKITLQRLHQGLILALCLQMFLRCLSCASLHLYSLKQVLQENHLC